MRRVAISELELELLVESSTNDRFVDIAFGPESVKVLVTPDNAWALDLLVEHRRQLDGVGVGEVLWAILETEKTGVLLGCASWSLEAANRCG